MNKDSVLCDIEKAKRQIRAYEDKIRENGFISIEEFADKLELERLIERLRRI